jgi:hypothetical protein
MGLAVTFDICGAQSLSFKDLSDDQGENSSSESNRNNRLLQTQLNGKADSRVIIDPSRTHGCTPPLSGEAG